MYPEDIEVDVYSNICQITEVWSGINHVNIWEMPFDMWVLYKANLREIERQRKAESR